MCEPAEKPALNLAKSERSRFGTEVGLLWRLGCGRESEKKASPGFNYRIKRYRTSSGVSSCWLSKMAEKKLLLEAVSALSQQVQVLREFSKNRMVETSQQHIQSKKLTFAARVRSCGRPRRRAPSPNLTWLQ